MVTTVKGNLATDTIETSIQIETHLSTHSHIMCYVVIPSCIVPDRDFNCKVSLHRTIKRN